MTTFDTALDHFQFGFSGATWVTSDRTFKVSAAEYASRRTGLIAYKRVPQYVGGRQLFFHCIKKIYSFTCRLFEKKKEGFFVLHSS